MNGHYEGPLNTMRLTVLVALAYSKASYKNKASKVTSNQEIRGPLFLFNVPVIQVFKVNALPLWPKVLLSKVVKEL